MNKFKIGSNVKWNGKKKSSLYFNENMEEFLKSKEVHTISKIDDKGVTCRLEGSRWVYDFKWLSLVEDGEIVNESIREQIKINNKLLNLKDKKQHKLKVLKEHKEWLEYQLEEVLNGTEWVSNKDNHRYKINSNISTDVALMMTNGYSLVLELRKELTRVKLAIINLE